jgi:type III secretory pathway component EscR
MIETAASLIRIVCPFVKADKLFIGVRIALRIEGHESLPAAHIFVTALALILSQPIYWPIFVTVVARWGYREIPFTTTFSAAANWKRIK